jgi:ATP-dependent 26S proteasome regulatory subunit
MDPKGRYVKTNPKLPTKVPSNLFGGRNTSSISSTEWYRKVKVGEISTLKDKKVSEERRIEETIEQKIETPTIVGQEVKPLEPSNLIIKTNQHNAFLFTTIMGF